MLFPVIAGISALGLLHVLASPAQAAPAPQSLPINPPPTPVPSSLRARFTPQLIALAQKWATARGLPLAWVLATIDAESGGNPNAQTHSTREDSYGLMQINWRAHGAEVTAAGYTAADLLNPDVNISFGTTVMRQVYDAIRAALGNKTPPAPLDVLMRLGYTGGASRVVNAIKNGTDPIALGPDTVTAWQRSVANTSALV